ncbi:MAG TPA: nitroreductase family protein [Acidimicrobiia bacterium]
MDLLEALYTTRAMRRVSPDPVPLESVAAMLDAAVRAPSGGNTQNWRFMVVTDPATRARLGPLYRTAFDRLQQTVYQRSWSRARETGDEATLRIIRSSAWLADNFEQVPLWLMAFSRNDPTGASIYPAVWNAMLAARGHGIGTCLTTILGIFEAEEVFEVLGVPTDRGWTMNAAVSCGYPLGRWSRAERTPAHEVAYADSWGTPLDFEIPDPLWPPGD